jgi:hypothetical protein
MVLLTKIPTFLDTSRVVADFFEALFLVLLHNGRVDPEMPQMSQNGFGFYELSLHKKPIL